LFDETNESSCGANVTESAGPAGAAGPDALSEQIAAAIRRERDRAGLSLTELARRASLAKSTLSQLESGGGNPSVETLWALGMALGIPFSRLVGEERPQVRVIRSGEGPVTYAERSSYAATLLSAGPSGVRRDLYRIAAEPGEPHRSGAHAAGTIEHLVVMTGRATAGLSPDPLELAPGDYLGYPADAPHVFGALEPGTTAIIMSEYR
jgi:transcriptional regulator with XRE-family HTH domain